MWSAQWRHLERQSSDDSSKVPVRHLFPHGDPVYGLSVMPKRKLPVAKSEIRREARHRIHGLRDWVLTGAFLSDMRRDREHKTDCAHGGCIMSDLMSIIKGRRSIRRFQDKPVPEKDLQQILEAVQVVAVLGEHSMLGDHCGQRGGDQGEAQGIFSAYQSRHCRTHRSAVVLALCGKLQSSATTKAR